MRRNGAGAEPSPFFRTLLRAFAHSRDAGVATIFALSVPVIAVLACAAVDLAAVNADRNAMQDVADATALSAAKQLTLAADRSGVVQRAEDFARSQLDGKGGALTYTVDTAIAQDGSSVTVTLAGVRTSFFGNLLPPGGWKMGASATAAPMGKRPLCVLASGSASNDGVEMKNSALITAPGCLLHTNSDIVVKESAWLQAAATQAVGAASGHITPGPLTDAPSISDPFASMNLSPVLGLCTPLDLVYDLGVTLLTPGVHCGNITVGKNATAILLPGEHYFLKGKLTLKENATLKGTDVVLVFDKDSDFAFQGGAEIHLDGRKTGRFAGFVISTTRENTHTFEISSDSARELLGTIYVPNATLRVSGTNSRVADQSAWTVVVARAMTVEGSANLVINANYAGSSVPVPSGVGPSSSATQVYLKK